MGWALAWVASIREDIGLLSGEFLPEFLLISLLLLVSWAVRKRLKRNAPPTS